jgi:hypothetical protein
MRVALRVAYFWCSRDVMIASLGRAPYRATHVLPRNLTFTYGQDMIGLIHLITSDNIEHCL